MTALVVIPLADLAAMIETQVERSVSRALAGATIQPPPEWVTVADYMATKGVTLRTVNRKIGAGELEVRGAGKTREVRVR